MLFTRKAWGRIIAATACIMMLTLTLIWSGCGGDEDEHSGKVSLKVRKKTSPDGAEKKTSTPMEESLTRPSGVEEEKPAPPEPDRKVSYSEAEAAYFERDYREAAELFTRYTEDKPDNPWGYYMLGLSAWKAQDYQQAEDAFKVALQADPGHVKSLKNLSRVFLDTRRPREALDRLNSALEIDPGSGTIYHLMGRAYRQMEETGKAIQAYREAIRADSSNAWAMNNLGLIYIREGQFEKALPPLARAVHLRSDMAVFQNNLGIALENTGHYRAAGKAYSSALDINEEYDKAFNNLTRVEVLEEDPEVRAIDLAEVAESYIRELNSSSDTASADSTATVIAGRELPLVVKPDSSSGGNTGSKTEPAPDPGDGTIIITDADSTGSKKK